MNAHGDAHSTPFALNRNGGKVSKRVEIGKRTNADWEALIGFSGKGHVEGIWSQLYRNLFGFLLGHPPAL